MAYLKVSVKVGSDNHFASLLRNLIEAVTTYLQKKRQTDWDLWDLLEILLQDRRKLEKVLAWHDAPKNSSLYKGLREEAFGRQDHGKDVISTIGSHLRKYAALAALWHTRSEEKKVSLRSWMDGSGVFILGWAGGSEEVMRTINQIFMKIFIHREIIQATVSSVKKTPDTWVVIDEATLLAPLPDVDRLLTNGLKHGISVVMGFQSIPKAKIVFGEGHYQAMLGQFSSVGIFRLEERESAEWAANLCGRYWKDEYTSDVTEGTNTGWSESTSDGDSSGSSSGESGGYSSWTTSKSTSSGKTEGTSGGESKSSTVRQQKVQRNAVEPEDFYHLPETSPRTGLSGVWLIKDFERRVREHHKVTMNWGYVQEATPPSSNIKGVDLLEADKIDRAIEKAVHNSAMSIDDFLNEI